MKKIFFFLLLISCNCLGQYTKLHDFSSTPDGNNPYGELISDGTFLYGMTRDGGNDSIGIIFKIKPDGSGYVKLFDFGGIISGANPQGSLISDGTFLYGMTSGGGINGDGTIFKIKPDGSGYLKLLDFAGATNGSSPFGSLIYSGTFLYGMTYGGGINDLGTIFKIKPDGSGFGKLHDFAGEPDGSYPYGSLIFDGTFLYGMTSAGGAIGEGSLIKIKPDGTGYANFFAFTLLANGANPYGSLIFDGTFLYGMTFGGGTYGYGTVFKIKPDGSWYIKLVDFADTTSGRYPQGSLISDGTYLYGMTPQGGTGSCPYGCGTIFKIKPDGSGYVKVFDFTGTISGRYPQSSLIYDGNFLYGMTVTGGTNDSGVIFKYDLAVGINELSPPNSPFTISPNPFTTSLTINRTEAQGSAAEVSLYDVAGKEILHQKTASASATLNTEGVAAGLYFLRVESGSGVWNYKVVKQ